MNKKTGFNTFLTFVVYLNMAIVKYYMYCIFKDVCTGANNKSVLCTYSILHNVQPLLEFLYNSLLFSLCLCGSCPVLGSLMLIHTIRVRWQRLWPIKI